jgi:hypothetical protein
LVYLFELGVYDHTVTRSCRYADFSCAAFQLPHWLSQSMVNCVCTPLLGTLIGRTSWWWRARVRRTRSEVDNRRQSMTLKRRIGVSQLFKSSSNGSSLDTELSDPVREESHLQSRTRDEICIKWLDDQMLWCASEPCPAWRVQTSSVPRL